MNLIKKNLSKKSSLNENFFSSLESTNDINCNESSDLNLLYGEQKQFRLIRSQSPNKQYDDSVELFPLKFFAKNMESVKEKKKSIQKQLIKNKISNKTQKVKIVQKKLSFNEKLQKSKMVKLRKIGSQRKENLSQFRNRKQKKENNKKEEKQDIEMNELDDKI